MLSCFGVKVKGRGQGQISRSRSKVTINVNGQGQRSRPNAWHTAVDVWGSALLSTAKSNMSHYHTEKKWSQNGSTLEPFWKTVPLSRVELFFSLIIMFEKKTVPPTKVVPFAKMAPLGSRFPEFFQKRLKMAPS